METKPADDLIDAMYAEWLMAQPEACICNGDRLVQCMERGWGWDKFVAQLPQSLAKALEEQQQEPEQEAPALTPPEPER